MKTKTGLAFFAALIIFLGGCMSMRPKDLGVTGGRLKACPDSPNCILSQAEGDPAHYLAPIKYDFDDKTAYDRVIKVINSMERTKIITMTDNYIHAEFTTKIMRYVDDVEFYFDYKNKTIHFRSASRIGYSDMGLNRKRMTEVAARFKNM